MPGVGRRLTRGAATDRAETPDRSTGVPHQGRRSPGTSTRLVGVLAVAFVLRLGWSLYAAEEPAEELHDPLVYQLFASSIASGDGYTYFDGEPTAYYPIGYPAALGAAFWLVDHSPLPDSHVGAVVGLNLVLGVASVGLVFFIARRLFDDTVGLAAAALVAVWPNLVFHTAVALTETLFIAVVLAALAVVVARPWRELGRGRLLAFGALLGVSVLVRSISAVMLPFVFVVAMAAGVGWRRALAQITWVSVAAVAVVTPWVLRNNDVMGAAVLSTNLGDNLCIGHNPGAEGYMTFASTCFGRFDNLSKGKREVEQDEANRRHAVDYALSHPGDEATLLVRKVYYLFKHDHDGLDATESYGDKRFLPTGVNTVLRWVANVWFWLIFALGVLRLPAFFSRRHPGRLLLGLSLVGLTAVTLVFFGDARFKVPSLPLLAIPAAVTIARLASRRPDPMPSTAP